MAARRSRVKLIVAFALLLALAGATFGGWYHRTRTPRLVFATVVHDPIVFWIARGDLLLVHSTSEDSIEVRSAFDGSLLRTIGHPDARYLDSAEDSDIVALEGRDKLELVRARSGEVARTIEGSFDTARLSPRGDRIVVAFRNRHLAWTTTQEDSSWRPLNVAAVRPSSGGSHIELSPDGELVSVSLDGQSQVFSFADGAVGGPFSGYVLGFASRDELAVERGTLSSGASAVDLVARDGGLLRPLVHADAARRVCRVFGEVYSRLCGQDFDLCSTRTGEVRLHVTKSSGLVGYSCLRGAYAKAVGGLIEIWPIP